MYKTLIDNTTLPILVVSPRGDVLFVNKGFEKFSGHAAGEPSAVHLRDFCTPYERNRFIFDNLDRISETIEIEIDLIQKNGQIITAGIIVTPINRNNQPALMLVFRDITGKLLQDGQERYRRLLAERNELEDQLKRSIRLACLGELAAGIAHEINNPLGIILGFSQEILDEIDENNPLWEHAKIIEQETTRCVKVVQGLLDLARPKPSQISTVNLARLVKDAVALLLQKLRKNRIEVRYDLAADLFGQVDPQQIQQAFLNLVINAIQAMPYGGELSVGLRPAEPSASTRRNFAEITIVDTGQGVASEHLDRLFEPFFSTKGSKGTGLGLAICQRIIEEHGGRIEIFSRLGVGTTCRIFLPLQQHDRGPTS